METIKNSLVVQGKDKEELFRISREGEMFVKGEKVLTDKFIADAIWYRYSIWYRYCGNDNANNAINQTAVFLVSTLK